MFKSTIIIERLIENKILTRYQRHQMLMVFWHWRMAVSVGPTMDQRRLMIDERLLFLVFMMSLSLEFDDPVSLSSYRYGM